MQLLQRRQQQEERGAGPAPANENAMDLTAVVVAGPYRERLPVVGLRVRDIRDRYGSLLDLDPRALAVISGCQVSENTIVGAADQLIFVSRAGEKGATSNPELALDMGLDSDEEFETEEEIRIRGETVEARLPEGISGKMELEALVNLIARREDPLATVCWPEGVRHVWSAWPLCVVLVELPPAIHKVSWIRADSPVPYGDGCLYSEYTLSMPFINLLLLYAYHETPKGLRLTQRCELMFNRERLRDLDAEVFLPCLLNASKFKSKTNGGASPGKKILTSSFAVPGKNISMYCLQFFSREHYYDKLNTNDRIQRSIAAVVSYLFSSSYNKSSSHSPLASGGGEEMAWHDFYVLNRVDERVSTPERWQHETKKRPQFILEVPFVPSGFSARQLAERLVREYSPPQPQLATAADLARIVLNHRPASASSLALQFNYPHRLWPTGT